MTFTEVALVQILTHYGKLTHEPFLRTMKSMPMDLLVETAKRFVGDTSYQLNESGDFVITFPYKEFETELRRKQARDVRATAGDLLTFKAAKNVIHEITGLPYAKIQSLRLDMGLDPVNRGRPTEFSDGELELIEQYWVAYSDLPLAQRLIRTSTFLRFSINDVWLVVKNNRQSNAVFAGASNVTQ